jgi:hypothetical protein
MSSEEHIVSKFNEGQLQTLRGHNSQDLLNMCKLNLPAWNEKFLNWNFNVVFNLLNILFAETSSKLKKPEMDEGLEYKKAIQGFMKKYPVFKVIKNEYKQDKKIDLKELEILEKFLFDYELFIRKIRESHGFSSPNKVEGLF